MASQPASYSRRIVRVPAEEPPAGPLSTTMCQPTDDTPSKAPSTVSTAPEVESDSTPINVKAQAKALSAGNVVKFEQGTPDVELRTSDGVKVQLDSRVLSYHSKVFGGKCQQALAGNASPTLRVLPVEENSEELLPVLSLLYKLDATWITTKNVRRLLAVCRKYDIHVVSSQHLIPFVSTHAEELILPKTFGEWVRLSQSLVTDIPDAQRIEEAAMQRFAKGRAFRMQVPDADLADLPKETLVKLLRATSAYDQDQLSTWGCAAYQSELENERRQLRALERASS